MKKILGIIPIALILCFAVFLAAGDNQAIAAPSATQNVTVTVPEHIAINASFNGMGNNSTITLGTILADNVQQPFTGGATGEQVSTRSNVQIDLWTKASGDFSSTELGADYIELSNFMYSDYNGAIGTATPFTTSYAKVINDWAKPHPVTDGGILTVPVDLYMTVPWGTAPATYNTTVYHSAIRHTLSGPPATP